MSTSSCEAGSKSYNDYEERINESLTECHVTPVGRRRDGGTRYWCLTHKADATAKYGKPSLRCRAAHIAPVSPEDTLILNIDEYPGGVALWGAVPPIYDTTRIPLCRGLHVHARKTRTGPKVVDRTVRAVRLLGGQFPTKGVNLSELDAIYYMVSTIFGFEMRHVVCSYCGYSHLDKDWFSVHMHTRHLCAGCGKYFKDSVSGIGNPIRQIQRDYDIEPKKPSKSAKAINIRQSEFQGGIQIWGSNPAFFWSSDRNEEEGIHVHVYETDGNTRLFDDTYSDVTIDGVSLEPMMVRTLMAQRALPHIENRVVSLTCVQCHASEFSIGEEAFTPISRRKCTNCGGKLYWTGRLRRVIGNPLIEILGNLAQHAPRTPQQHSSGLLPEAPSNQF